MFLGACQTTRLKLLPCFHLASFMISFNVYKAGSSYSVIKVQLAYISNFHSGFQNCFLASQTLQSLTVLFHMYSPIKVPTPPWDLSFVLEALTKPLFEPGCSTELKLIEISILDHNYFSQADLRTTLFCCLLCLI